MLDSSASINASLCPLCGKSNLCAMEMEKETGEKQAPCWCVNVDFSANLLSSLPSTARGRSCICAACAAKAAL
jgi:Cysteine-rich CWC